MELSDKDLIQRLRSGLAVLPVTVTEQAPRAITRPRTFSEYLKMRRELELLGPNS